MSDAVVMVAAGGELALFEARPWWAWLTFVVERVVRVPTRLMVNSRRSSRERGKSDRIDAVCVARAALVEGIPTLSTAELAGPELDVRLLVDDRERLVGTR